MKFNRNRLIRSRDIDVLVSIRSIFFKLEVDAQTHKNYIFFESGGHAAYNLFLKLQQNFEISQNMQILQILVQHSENLMSCDFLKKLLMSDLSQNKYILNFNKNKG